MLTITKAKATIVLAMLAAAVIAAPSAGARPIDGPSLPNTADAAYVVKPDPGHSSDAGAADVLPTRTVEVSSSGFDWGDAALGAGAMLSLLGLGTGAVMIGRRARAGSTPATS